MVSSNTELKLEALKRVGISPAPLQRLKNDGANTRHHAIENPMRILVYASDSDKDAKRVIEDLRSEGHHASLRNAQFYAGEIEPADGVVVRHGHSQKVVDAYEAAGKPVRFFGFEDTQAVEQSPEPVGVDPETDSPSGPDAESEPPGAGEAQPEAEASWRAHSSRNPKTRRQNKTKPAQVLKTNQSADAARNRNTLSN